MEREDYILRMIAQMARVLARIRRMLLEGKNSEAGDELEHAAQKAGIDLRFVIALDDAPTPAVDALHKLLTGDRIGEHAIVTFVRGVELRRHAIIPLEMPSRA